MFVVAIDAFPSQACTVTGSTPRASHKRALDGRRHGRITRDVEVHEGQALGTGER